MNAFTIVLGGRHITPRSRRPPGLHKGGVSLDKSCDPRGFRAGSRRSGKTSFWPLPATASNGLISPRGCPGHCGALTKLHPARCVWIADLSGR